MSEAKKYQKKPVVVEAVQFTGDNWSEMHEFTGHSKVGGRMHDTFTESHVEGWDALVWDKLHETWVKVKAGQWIIKGVHGEFYPCDEDVFAETYIESDEPLYTLAEARQIVLRNVCLREGGHDMEQMAVNSTEGTVTFVMWCARCGIRFEEKE